MLSEKPDILHDIVLVKYSAQVVEDCRGQRSFHDSNIWPVSQTEIVAL